MAGGVARLAPEERGDPTQRTVFHGLHALGETPES